MMSACSVVVLGEPTCQITTQTFKKCTPHRVTRCMYCEPTEYIRLPTLVKSSENGFVADRAYYNYGKSYLQIKFCCQ